MMKEIVGYTAFCLLIIFVVLSSGCVEAQITAESIGNFEECVAAGYPVMESYPRQCSVPGGQIFTEELEPIGGQRDEHGCLGPAGYTWNETPGFCLREWEVKDGYRKAAEIAGEYLEEQYGLTLVSIDPYNCPGCYYMEFETGENRDMISVDIMNWEVSSEETIRHTCTEGEKQAGICTLEYDPVCGYKDGESNTYGNGCGACASDVDYWVSGECKN